MRFFWKKVKFVGILYLFLRRHGSHRTSIHTSYHASRKIDHKPERKEDLSVFLHIILEQALMSVESACALLTSQNQNSTPTC